MKLTIDIESKSIQLHEELSMLELLQVLDTIFDKQEWIEYNIKCGKEVATPYRVENFPFTSNNT
jgi:hypothetical protein